MTPVTRRTLEMMADRCEAVYASHMTPVRCTGGDISPLDIRLTLIILRGYFAVAPGQVEMALTLRRTVEIERVSETQVLVIVGYTEEERLLIATHERGDLRPETAGALVAVAAERLPLVVAEPAPAAPGPVAAGPAEPGEAERSERWFKFFVVYTAVWFVVTTVLTVTGAMFPIEGNVVAYLVLMAGLFCGAFLALTCPRPEEPETFWTWGSEPAAVGQCTPSRQTLTGRD